MSSLAQEESRSISENVTWGQRKRFANGKVSFAYKRFLGYDKDSDGNIVINEGQAKTVKLIYKLFLDGLTMHSIANELTKRGLKTPAGKDNWSQSTVRSILTNEKYKGDALLQKSYTVDFLPRFSVLSVAVGTAARFGTPMINTEEPSINAITSSGIRQDARLHICSGKCQSCTEPR